jgi:hypothetical protein
VNNSVFQGRPVPRCLSFRLENLLQVCFALAGWQNRPHISWQMLPLTWVERTKASIAFPDFTPCRYRERSHRRFYWYFKGIRKSANRFRSIQPTRRWRSKQHFPKRRDLPQMTSLQHRIILPFTSSRRMRFRRRNRSIYSKPKKN